MSHIKKKLLKIGGSRCLILPKFWLDSYEAQHGKINKVSIEIKDNLIIQPILPKDTRTSEGDDN